MSWLDRQSFLGNDSEQVLLKTRIGIVGLGGGGSHVAQQLAHVGIGAFVLVDPDVIEDTNLNRLVGGTRDDVEIRTPKVMIAERVIKGVRPDAQVATVQDYWQAAGDALKLCDVIVGGLDKVSAKSQLDSFCRRHLIPYIDMGMDVHGHDGKFLIAGQVVLSAPGGPCLRCCHVVTETLLEKEAKKYGEAGSNPQVVWPNGVLASSAVGLLVRLVTPWASTERRGAYLEYDGNLGTVTESQRMTYMKPGHCRHYPADELGDPGFDVRLLSTTS
ncbi:ThiF family adenylyltransferase [Rhodopseudomonas palustris]|nr:ThiF family adenylyltransferase [Rhodopseudomonas palustris]